MKQEQDLDEVLTELGIDVVREVKRKKPLIPLFLFALCVAALVFSITTIVPLVKLAKDTGRAVGDTAGTVAGLAVGSVEGATQGVQEGYVEGTEEGLSANDTVVELAKDIEGSIRDLGQLQVLAVNVDLPTYHEVGKKYAALYLLRGNAIFTVDLSKMDVTYNENKISILLPAPEVKLNIDHSETELMAERQRVFFNGKDSDGLKAYLNTLKIGKNRVENEIANYDALMELASAFAKKQIEDLANAVHSEDENVDISVNILSN